MRAHPQDVLPGHLPHVSSARVYLTFVWKRGEGGKVVDCKQRTKYPNNGSNKACGGLSYLPLRYGKFPATFFSRDLVIASTEFARPPLSV